MTNKEILELAMQQSAIDLNCNRDDFYKSENVVVISTKSARARRYLMQPFTCYLVSYGNNVVASVDNEIADIVKNYIDTYPLENCFVTPNLYVLNDELQKREICISHMVEYFLPDIHLLRELSCAFDLKVLTSDGFEHLYLPQWSNALCKKRKHLDVLGTAAFDGDKLIGLAGCSADCDTMWQIGVDVLPEYRQHGIASALTSRLAIEVLNRGKVPFYGASWSNIKSVRNAIKCGFRPAWIEMSAKNCDTDH